MKLLGESEIEEALQRMDQLTQEAVQIGVAETLAAVHGLSDNMRVIMGMILLETGITCAIHSIQQDLGMIFARSRYH